MNVCSLLVTAFVILHVSTKQYLSLELNIISLVSDLIYFDFHNLVLFSAVFEYLVHARCTFKYILLQHTYRLYAVIVHWSCDCSHHS